MIHPGDHIADPILSAAIDDQLTPEEARVATPHLETCGVCRARLDELRSVVGLLRALPALDAPRDFSIGPRLVVDTPNVVRLRRWYGFARAGAASLAAAFVFLSAGALYVDSKPASSPVGLAAQLPAASAPAPAAPAVESAPPPAATVAVPTPALKAAAPAAPASAAAPAAPAAGALAARSQPAPTATGADAADQVTAATSVRPLPTPVPTLSRAPTPAQPSPQVAPPLTTASYDSAAPLRTAAASVGILAAIGLLATLVIRHRLRAASTAPTE